MSSELNGVKGIFFFYGGPCAVSRMIVSVCPSCCIYMPVVLHLYIRRVTSIYLTCLIYISEKSVK